MVEKVREGPTTYVVSFPRVLPEVEFPVLGCLTVTHSVGRLREQFMYRHFRSNLAVVQEGAGPLPRCDLCIIYMPAGRLIKHQRMVCCDKNTQMRWGIRDVVISDKCLEANLSLTGEYKAECI